MAIQISEYLSISDVRFGNTPRDIANVPGPVYQSKALPRRRKSRGGNPSGDYISTGTGGKFRQVGLLAMQI
jgi:hypothetical protein